MASMSSSSLDAIASDNGLLGKSVEAQRKRINSAPAPVPSDLTSDERSINREKIWNMLFVSDMSLLVRICRVTQFTNGFTIATSMMTLLRENGVAEVFLTKLISDRIRQTKLIDSNDMSNVLRDNSIAVLMLNSFTKFEGGHYLRQTLRPLIKELIPQASRYEVNPVAIPADQSLEENQKFLADGVLTTLKRLQQQQVLLPMPIRRICIQVRAECIQRIKEAGFDEDAALASALKVVGCLLCLRFFGPALTSPVESLKLKDCPLSVAEKRGFILLSKVFVSVASGMSLGQKEEYLQPLNALLIPARQEMMKYLQAASEPLVDILSIGDGVSHARSSSAYSTISTISVAQMNFDTALDNVIRFLQQSMPKLEAMFSSQQTLRLPFEDVRAITILLDLTVDTEKAKMQSISMFLDTVQSKPSEFRRRSVTMSSLATVASTTPKPSRSFGQVLRSFLKPKSPTE